MLRRSTTRCTWFSDLRRLDRSRVTRMIVVPLLAGASAQGSRRGDARPFLRLAGPASARPERGRARWQITDAEASETAHGKLRGPFLGITGPAGDLAVMPDLDGPDGCRVHNRPPPAPYRFAIR